VNSLPGQSVVNSLGSSLVDLPSLLLLLDSVSREWKKRILFSNLLNRDLSMKRPLYLGVMARLQSDGGEVTYDVFVNMYLYSIISH
jgi:hypothetical protein